MKSTCPCHLLPGAQAESRKFVLGGFDNGVSKCWVTAVLFDWVDSVPIQAPVMCLRVPFCIMESLADQDSAGECKQNSEYQHYLQFSFPRQQRIAGRLMLGKGHTLLPVIVSSMHIVWPWKAVHEGL